MATGSDVNETQSCTEDLPTTALLAKNMPLEGHILVSLLVLFSFLTLLIYVDEIIFIRKRIRRGTRTMWVLACFPVFSLTSLLAVFIPRSGVVVDMVASGFFATCLYNFGRLMIRYMGGTGQLWKLFESGRKVSFRTVPVCCCCFCIPLVPFRMKVYNGIRTLVMQVAIIRPILTFIAVILYVDGTFKPGSITFGNPYTYVGICNIISTMTAVYGLMILRGVFQPELEQRFKLTGKIISVQLTLFSSILPNVIINILVSTEVIGCSTLFPSKARGEMICHVVIVLIMLPLALLAQRFFRRSSDGDTYFDQKSNIASSSTSTHDNQQQQQLDEVDKHLPVAVTDAMDKNCTLIAMRPLSTDTDLGETNV